jgi:hypothetical protein
MDIQAIAQQDLQTISQHYTNNNPDKDTQKF